MMLRALAVLLCLLLMACGGGGGTIELSPLPQSNDSLEAPATENPVTEQPVLAQDGELQATAEPANKLVLNVPDLSGLTSGDEFDVSLVGAFSDEVYQGSMRLLFDSAYFKPVEAVRGSLLLDDMVHIASLDQAGFVPFAFTGLPGHNALEPGAGELLRVRFRVLQPGAALHRIMLQNETEFLQIRDRQSRRLKFDLESRAGVQQ